MKKNEEMNTIKQVAWIGTGVMGKSMARNLQQHGWQVRAYNRTASKAVELEQYGIQVCSSIEEALEGADAVFTIVGFPKDVEEVYAGEHGIFKYGKPGLYAIDMTTSSPKLAKQLFEDGQQHGIKVMDAPVSGGDIGAKNATLSIMVGGTQEDYQVLLPLFEAMGKNIKHMGVAGNGQHTKMANQIGVAGAIAAASEAIVYAKSVGLDPNDMLEAISSGAAGSWQLNNNAPKVLKKDYAPGFYIKHFVKDMHLAEESSIAHGVHLEMLRSVCAMYESLMARGYEDEGTQALVEYYQDK